MIKFKNKIIFLIIFFSNSLFSFPVYKGKEISVNMNMLLGIDFFYKLTKPPGLGGFRISNSKIKIDAKYLKKIKAKISFDFSKIDKKKFHMNLLKKAFLQYDFNNFFKVRTGKFKAPFGKEISQGIKKRHYIYHSQSSKAVPGYSLGLQFSGENIFKYLSYKVGFLNLNNKEFVEEINGNFTLCGNFQFDFRYFNLGYQYLADTAERFSQGVFFLHRMKFRKDFYYNFFFEFIEERYFNYYWNNSFFSNLSLRVKSFEPLLYLDFFNNKVGFDGLKDNFIFGIGFNSYFLKDKLKIMIDIHTNYLYSLKNVENLKFYDNKITIKILMEL